MLAADCRSLQQENVQLRLLAQSLGALTLTLTPTLTLTLILTLTLTFTRCRSAKSTSSSEGPSGPLARCTFPSELQK